MALNMKDGGSVTALIMADGGWVGRPALWMANGGEVKEEMTESSANSILQNPNATPEQLEAAKAFYKNYSTDASAIIDFIPILGDIKGAAELVQELRKTPVNWTTVGVLAAALLVGAIPGAGDALAAGIKSAIKRDPKILQKMLVAFKEGNYDFIKSFGKAGKVVTKMLGDLKSAIMKRAPELPATAADDYLTDLTPRITEKIEAGTELEQVFRETLDELEEKVRNAGYDIKYIENPEASVVNPYSTDVAADGRGTLAGSTVYIPAGLTPKEVAIALEEFKHILNDNAMYDKVGMFVAEANAKAEAYQEVIEMGGEFSREEFHTLRGYFLDYIVRVPTLDDWKRIAPPDNHAIWDLFEIDPDSIRQIIGDYGGTGGDAAIAGVKAAKEITFHIKQTDGTVSEHLMTPAAFAEFIGKSASATKKGVGRTSEGLQWAKNPEDFKEFASGATKATVGEFIDPSTVTRTKGARMGWSGIESTTRTAIEKDVQVALGNVAKAKADDMGVTLAEDGILKFNSDYVDFALTKEFGEELGEEAWGAVSEALTKYQEELGPEKWNKLMGWARNRIFNAFNKEFDGRVTFGVLSGMGKSTVRNFEEALDAIKTVPMNTEAGHKAINKWIDQWTSLSYIKRQDASNVKGYKAMLEAVKQNSSASPEVVERVLNLMTRSKQRIQVPNFAISLSDQPLSSLLRQQKDFGVKEFGKTWILEDPKRIKEMIEKHGDISILEHTIKGNSGSLKDFLEVFGTSDQKAKYQSALARFGKTVFKRHGGLVAYP